MKEKIIEQYLVKEVKKLSGIPYKFKSPQRRSVPDRLCVFNHALIAFVEVKAANKFPTDAQNREMNRLESRGQWVLWVNSKSGIDNFIKKVKLMLGGDET